MAVDDSYTRNLLHFDGADAATIFTDESGNIWIAAGTAQLDTAQLKFGGSSLLLDGNSDYLYLTNLAIGAREFTIDFWFRTPAFPGSHMALVAFNTPSQDDGRVIYADPANKLITYGADVRIQGTTVMSNDTWYHAALVGNGGAAGARTQKLYLNGTQEGSTDTSDYNYTMGTTHIGVHSNKVQQFWSGWIDEFRISVGIQRWTGNFTPPTISYRPNNTYLIARRDRFRTTGISLG